LLKQNVLRPYLPPLEQVSVVKTQIASLSALVGQV